MDPFTIRGVVYTLLSSLGLGYEFFFIEAPRPFLLIMYTCVIGIGLICIFLLEDKNRQKARDSEEYGV